MSQRTGVGQLRGGTTQKSSLVVEKEKPLQWNVNRVGQKKQIKIWAVICCSKMHLVLKEFRQKDVIAKNTGLRK